MADTLQPLMIFHRHHLFYLVVCFIAIQEIGQKHPFDGIAPFGHDGKASSLVRVEAPS